MDIGSLLNARSPKTGNIPSPANSRAGARPPSRTHSPMHTRVVPRPLMGLSSAAIEYNDSVGNQKLRHTSLDRFSIYSQASFDAANLARPVDQQSVLQTDDAQPRARSERNSQSYSDNGSFNYDPSAYQTEPVHEASAGSQAPAKTYACSTCSKTFARRSDLARHDRIHTGTRPHVCDICSKPFIQRSALTVHKRVHTGEKPHECDQCQKGFSDSSSLARHRRTHDGSRPHVCSHPGCSKTFTRRTTLRRHEAHHVGSASGDVTAAPNFDHDRRVTGEWTKSRPSVHPAEDNVSTASSPLVSEQAYSRRTSLAASDALMITPVYQPASEFPVDAQLGGSLAVTVLPAAPTAFSGGQQQSTEAPAHRRTAPQQYMYGVAGSEISTGRMYQGAMSSTGVQDPEHEQFGTVGYRSSNYFLPQTGGAVPFGFGGDVPTNVDLGQEVEYTDGNGGRSGEHSVPQYQWQPYVAGDTWVQGRPLS